MKTQPELDAAVADAEAKMHAAWALARPVMMTDHRLALAADAAYYDWIRALWDAGHAQTRSAWKDRPL